MVLPNSAPIFPTPGFLPSPQLCVVPDRQGPKVLSLRGHHNLASVSADNGPIEPSRSLSFCQSGLDLLLGVHRCLLDLNELVLVVENPDSKRMTASAP